MMGAMIGAVIGAMVRLRRSVRRSPCSSAGCTGRTGRTAPQFGLAWGRLLCAWVLLAAATGVQAHKPSDSYLRLSVDPLDGALQVAGRWDIALRDLDPALELDADGNGAITWAEVRNRHADIAAYALQRLSLKADGGACTLQAGTQQIESYGDGRYTTIPLIARCAGGGRLQIDYSLFADLDPQHRGLLSLSAGGATRSAVLDPTSAGQIFELAAPDRLTQFKQFLWQGVVHIWIGIDHILFLVSLLLPAVLVLASRSTAAGSGTPKRGMTTWADSWEPAPAARPASMDVVKVVTAFTVAHSITLSLAALEVVTLPSALVESAIAASVVLAALNNIRPVVGAGRWAVAFGFGLIHGFGFASVLAELGLPADALVLALLAFNLGVELGQLAIVLAFLPLAWALRRTRLYRQGVLMGGSALIAVAAGAWFLERAFGVAFW